MTEYSRSFGLEDISIRSGGDGRTVEAYASIFDIPTRISDRDGEYEEIIDRKAFNAAIASARPTGGRENWRCGVLFNHGMTVHGTPSETHSVPIGTCIDMRADARGLLTVTRYHKSAEAILESIREGSINAYSFSGSFRRSSPSPTGKFRRNMTTGRLPTVRRLESSLREYGPTPFPAYPDAVIVGVRTEQLDPEELRRKELRREYARLEAARIVAEGPMRERQYAAARARQIVADGPVLERRVAALRSVGIEDRRSRWSH